MNKRKLFLSILLTLLCIGLLAASASAARILGDVDGNGEVTPADARLALRFSLGLMTDGDQTFSEEDVLMADANLDGEVQPGDARAILRYALNLESLHTHNFGTWIPEVEGRKKTGYHVRSCICGEQEREACEFGDWILKDPDGPTQATCTESVIFVRTCEKCKANKLKQEKALNHVLKENGQVVKEKTIKSQSFATCTEPGLTVWSCPICGQDGDTTEDPKSKASLYIETPALGHHASSTSISGDADITCDRCGKVLTPSFNSLVNALKNDPTGKSYLFSQISRQVSNGTLSDYDITIPSTAKTLMSVMGESMDEETIVDQLVDALDSPDASYSEYLADSPFLRKYYPLPDQDVVSKLTAEDIVSLNVQELSAIDFMEEIPDSITVVKTLENGTTRSWTYPLDAYKELGNSAVGNIQKITVTLKTERYSNLKNSTEETALMRATNLDIRQLPEKLSRDESQDGMTLVMTCNDVETRCTISYYFLVTEDELGEKTYTPVASRYDTDIIADQHITLKASIPVSELGDSKTLKAALTMLGLAQGDDIVFMQGWIDLKVADTETDFYLFEEYNW